MCSPGKDGICFTDDFFFLILHRVVILSQRYNSDDISLLVKTATEVSTNCLALRASQNCDVTA